MRLICLPVAGLLMSATASAQLAPIRLPAPAPPPAAPETSEISRKMNVLETAGLIVAPTSLQESVVLSARQPWRDSRTFVDFTGVTGYSVRNSSARIAGVPMLSSAYSPRPHAELVWSADASKRHIIDCEVAGPATQIKFRWTEPAGEVAATISGGRISTVLPTGVAGSVKLSAEKEWQFRSCEITPVAI